MDLRLLPLGRVGVDRRAWEGRRPARPVGSACDEARPVPTVLNEVRGEAVAAEAEGYWTLSEGKGAGQHRDERP